MTSTVPLHIMQEKTCNIGFKMTEYTACHLNHPLVPQLPRTSSAHSMLHSPCTCICTAHADVCWSMTYPMFPTCYSSLQELASVSLVTTSTWSRGRDYTDQQESDEERWLFETGLCIVGGVCIVGGFVYSGAFCIVGWFPYQSEVMSVENHPSTIKT